MRWFVLLCLCAARWASAEDVVRLETFGNTPIDKLAIVHDQLWAAGGGSVFVYEDSKWVSPFKKTGQGEVYAMSAITATSKDRKNPATSDLGIVCFARDRGLCSIYDPRRNRSFALNENEFRNYAAPGSLLSLLQHHGRGSPLLFATNQNSSRINEVPLQLVELTNEDFLARTGNDVVNLSLKPYLGHVVNKEEAFSIRFRGWKAPFPAIHYLHSFQLNGFVYIVTVQPLIDTSRLKFETRLARFCLDDYSMTTYSEVPIRCKTEHNVFDLANHARFVNHGGQALLFVSMGKNDKNERHPDPQGKSAICVFNVEELDDKFKSTITQCDNGAEKNGVRKLKYYQENRETGPLVCEQTNRRRQTFCEIGQRNKYIVSMTEYEGKVIYSNERKTPADVTYIFNSTRMISAPVGLLTAFEVDLPETSFIGGPLFLWASDHLGQLHRILYIERNGSTPAESMLLVTVPAIAKNGFNVQSVHYEAAGRSMFLINRTLVDLNARDHCSIYLNCGDCLNPYDLTRHIINCSWEDDKCVPTTDDKENYAVCKPAVNEKGPFTGPERGGTRFKIKGFDLGVGEESAVLTFGSQKCRIVHWDNMTGICEVPPDRDNAKKVDVNFYVKDLRIDTRLKTFHIESNGPQKLGTFTYYSVQFYGVNPSFGPRAGGTQLRVVGLNIGKSGPQAQYGLFGNGDQLICKDFQVRNESEMWCNTTELFGPSESTEKIFNLSLKIDGVSYEAIDRSESSQVFVYQPNPKNIKLSAATRSDFFARGSRSYPIIFTGEHLDAGAFPKLLVKPLGMPPLAPVPCISNSSALSCQAPPLPRDKLLFQALPATATLLIDNFKYEDPGLRITYFPNATILLNDGDKFFIDADGPSDIVIRGKNLLPLAKDQVKVFLDNEKCEINSIEENSIECRLTELVAGEYSIEVEVEGRKYSALMSTIVTAGKGLGWAATLTIVVGCLVILVAMTFLILRYVPLRKKVVKAEPVVTYTPENDGYLHPDNERLLTTIPPDPEMISLLSDEGLLMDFSCIQVGALIGKGQFGCVYRGVLKRDKLSDEEPVAVKTLQQRGYTTNDANVFLKEALRMKDFNHQNVLRLIGVSFDNNNATDPMIIVPYMANGDLLTYIRNQENKPTVKDLITFGANIALGMSYLTTQKFVHRDLAARNCMLGVDLIVRVADFGLSRDVYETSYYSSDNSKTKLPVKWMAIESLVEGVYSHRSDVWSYGVVLWELMTRGCVPYPNVDNWDVHNWLKDGRRMLQPNFCPDALYQIMLACWDEDPKKRPTFSQLVKDVPNVIHTIETASRNQVPNYVNV